MTYQFAKLVNYVMCEILQKLKFMPYLLRPLLTKFRH